MDNSDEILKLLNDKSTVKRRSAVKKIMKNELKEYGAPLLSLLFQELKTENNWKTQIEIIKALEKIEFKVATKLLYEICEKSEEHSLVASASASAYVKLETKSLSNISPILKLLKLNKFSVSMGALEKLGKENFVLEEIDIKNLISQCWNLGQGEHKGFGDPRYGLIIACSRWEKEIVTPFLFHCSKTGDSFSKELAEKVLNNQKI